jgi:hypothetical protein
MPVRDPFSPDAPARATLQEKGTSMDLPTGSGPSLSRRMLMTAGAGVVGAVGLGLAGAVPATAAEQNDWYWCNRCQCLFYGGNYTTGWCTRGGGHNYQGSGNYTPSYGSGSGQHGWRWCNKCQSMWYGGSSGRGSCPSGSGHRGQGSGDYRIEYGNPKHGEQEGWRWCNKCYCLCYSGNGNGYCPKGGKHNYNGSGDYYLAYQ